MKRLIVPAILALVGLTAATAIQVHAENSNRTFHQFDQLVDVFERVRAEYVEPVDEEKVLEAAINGMLSSLDPHSSYMGPESFRAMQIQTEGEFGGLGIEVSMKDGLVLVVAPIDDTPAARAGVKSGDLISHIDGKPIMGLNLQDAIEKMRGAVGTPISVTILREGMETPFDITIIRAAIKVRSVRSEIHDNVGYVRISTFNRQTYDGLKKEVEQIRSKLGTRLVGLVLDLRGNPGGLLDQAVDVSDAFLDRGEIVSTRGRRKEDIQRYPAQPGDISGGVPVIVLMNPYSASASEIVAGALQDHKRAVILGTQSFGKGTVQTIIPLGPDSAIRLTTARYYTPSGRSIQEMGIAPDIHVDQIREVAATPVQRQREADLPGHFVNENGAEQPMAGDDQPLTRLAITDKDGKPVEDYQLSYALELMKGIAEARNAVASN